MAMQQEHGVLALWNNVVEGREADFERWYSSEHLLERIAVPGFLRGRRYEAVDGDPRFFCYYETESPGVLGSAAYKARLDDPTPLTRAIMNEVFRDMTRSACRRIAQWGTLSCGLAVTARFDAPADPARAGRVAAELRQRPGITRCELWHGVDDGAPPALEEKLRGGDRRIAACLLVQAARLDDARAARTAMTEAFAAAATVGIYRLLMEVDKAGTAGPNLG